jgi:hypothetical protein
MSARRASGVSVSGAVSLERSVAADLLSRLHAAQERFYGGGDSAPLHEVLDPDVSWYVPGRNAVAGEYRGIEAVLNYMAVRRDHNGAEHRWSTVGLYRVRADRIVECRLLPLDPEQFDRIWAVRDEEPTPHPER